MYIGMSLLILLFGFLGGLVGYRFGKGKVQDEFEKGKQADKSYYYSDLERKIRNLERENMELSNRLNAYEAFEDGQNAFDVEETSPIGVELSRHGGYPSQQFTKFLFRNREPIEINTTNKDHKEYVARVLAFHNQGKTNDTTRMETN